MVIWLKVFINSNDIDSYEAINKKMIETILDDIHKYTRIVFKSAFYYIMRFY